MFFTTANGSDSINLTHVVRVTFHDAGPDGLVMVHIYLDAGPDHLSYMVTPAEAEDLRRKIAAIGTPWPTTPA